jgi:ribonuclease HII
VVYSIAAASILAKVFRDRLMNCMSALHPNYDWENNKGYGTPLHRQAIISLGLTNEHRTLFVRKIH